MLLGGRRVVRGDFRRELTRTAVLVCDCDVQDFELSWQIPQNFTTKLPVQGRRSISFYLERKHQGINVELILLTVNSVLCHMHALNGVGPLKDWRVCVYTRVPHQRGETTKRENTAQVVA